MIAALESAVSHQALPAASLDRSGAEDGRLYAQQSATVCRLVDGGPQAVVVVVPERNEAEGLEHSLICLPHRAENFRHAMHQSGLHLKFDFDEVSLPERTWHLQQSAGGRNGLEFSFCVAAIF
jgi:hypothetical protein